MGRTAEATGMVLPFKLLRGDCPIIRLLFGVE
jgi:hypothetical protein